MIETLLTAELANLKYRVFPLTAPFGTQLPYITYQIIGGSPLIYMDNTEADKQPATVQINVFSDQVITSSRIAGEITRYLLASSTLTATPLSHPTDIDDDEPNLDIFGKTQDLVIWYSTQ